MNLPNQRTSVGGGGGRKSPFGLPFPSSPHSEPVLVPVPVAVPVSRPEIANWQSLLYQAKYLRPNGPPTWPVGVEDEETKDATRLFQRRVLRSPILDGIFKPEYTAAMEKFLQTKIASAQGTTAADKGTGTTSEKTADNGASKRSTLRDVGLLILLTSPAWGSYLYTRYRR